MVGILAQAVDAAVGAERKLVLREEVGAAGERRQKAADLLQRRAVDAVLLDPPGLVDQVPDGRGALLVLVHLVLRWPQYSGPWAIWRLLPPTCRYAAIDLRWENESPCFRRPAGSSDDAGRVGAGADHDQAAGQACGRHQDGCGHQGGRTSQPRGGQAPSHHRPAPAGLRAATAGDRARRNRRGRRSAHGARHRHKGNLPPHLPGAGRRPVRPGRRRHRAAQGQDPDGLCRRPAPAEPGRSRALRGARRLAAGIQRPSRCAGDLPAGARPPHARLARADAVELRRPGAAVAQLRRRPHRERRRRRARRRAQGAPAGHGRRWRLQRRLRAPRPEVDGRGPGAAGGRAVARPHPHPRPRGRFAARRAAADRCRYPARRHLERGAVGLHPRQHGRCGAPLRAGGRCGARPGLFVDAVGRLVLGGARQPAGRQSAEIRALSQARGAARPHLLRPDRPEGARHAHRAGLERAGARPQP